MRSKTNFGAEAGVENRQRCLGNWRQGDVLACLSGAAGMEFLAALGARQGSVAQPLLAVDELRQECLSHQGAWQSHFLAVEAAKIQDKKILQRHRQECLCYPRDKHERGADVA